MGLFRRKTTDPEPQTRGVPWYWPTQSLGNTARLLDGWPASGDDTATAVPTVYRCVELITTQLAQFPAEAYRRRDRRLVPDQPMILRRPDPRTDSFLFLEGTVCSLLLRGNSYWLITSMTADVIPRAASLELLDPDRVTVTLSDGGEVVYRYAGQVLDRDRVVHTRMLTTPGSLVGLSPIRAAATVIDSQRTADAMARSNFTDGTFPSGAINTPGQLTADKAAELKAQFVAANAGTREPVVMSGGSSFEPFAITARDSQWIEHRQWTASDIARLFGVPAAMLSLPQQGGMNLTYTNTSMVRTAFLHTGLGPVLARLESAFSSLLPSTQEARFDTADYLRADPKTRAEIYAAALSAGWMSVDEVRDAERFDGPAPDRPSIPTPSDAILTDSEQQDA